MCVRVQLKLAVFCVSTVVAHKTSLLPLKSSNKTMPLHNRLTLGTFRIKQVRLQPLTILTKLVCMYLNFLCVCT